MSEIVAFGEKFSDKFCSMLVQYYFKGVFFEIYVFVRCP